MDETTKTLVLISAVLGLFSLIIFIAGPLLIEKMKQKSEEESEGDE